MPQQPSLGQLVRRVRQRNGWTLKEMSERSGIPMSTLSKVEHDRLTLTYDKLQQLGDRLGMRMSELFAEGDAESRAVTARRSIGRMAEALKVETPRYDYYYLSTELRRKAMMPLLISVKARTLEDFGELSRHPGEEFVYVVTGAIEVHTEFYDPVTLAAGDSIYLDSTMGHGFLVAPGCDEALVVNVASAEAEQLMPMLTRQDPPPPANEIGVGGQKRATRRSN
jgi:transcriptional regulator with XRE-family HTH domain